MTSSSNWEALCACESKGDYPPYSAAEFAWALSHQALPRTLSTKNHNLKAIEVIASCWAAWFHRTLRTPSNQSIRMPRHRNQNIGTNPQKKSSKKHEQPNIYSNAYNESQINAWCKLTFTHNHRITPFQVEKLHSGSFMCWPRQHFGAANTTYSRPMEVHNRWPPSRLTPIQQKHQEALLGYLHFGVYHN